MKPSIEDILPEEIRKTITDNPEEAARMLNAMTRLQNTAEWQLLMRCVGHYRETVIGHIKNGSEDAVKSLVAIDMLKELPKGIGDAIRTVYESLRPAPGAPESGEDGFGFVDEGKGQA